MIDLKAKTITGKSGKVYRIDPENISAGRFHHYMIQSATVGLGITFQEIFDSYVAMLKAVTTGNDILKALATVKNECESKLKIVDKYTAQTAPKIIEFCALFCIEDGEDVGQYDEALVARKFEDWKHIPLNSFFLLSSMAIPAFQENYRSMLEGGVEELINPTI